MDYYGFMTDKQIRKAIEEKEIIIYPFEETNLTPVGYNFSFSKFIISFNKKNFVPIVEDKKNGDFYFILKPNETVLALTRETISVPKNIGGTFHSKVSLVTSGLGHVSTTLDPGWQGQLLVPLNNPTKRNIKIVIEENNDNKIVFKTFLTLVMFKSSDWATKNAMDNKPARIEILENIIHTKRAGKKREKLLSAVKTLTAFYGTNGSIIDLSTNILRRQNYKNYIEQQEDLMKKLIINYPIVRKAAQELNFTNKVIYCGIVFTNIVLLVTMSLYGYFSKHDIISNMVQLLVPILIPFSVFFLNNIKDRYI